MTTKPPSSAARASKPQQRWLTVFHPAGRRSRVAHYVLTPTARGSIAYEACWQDGHSHDWRDCPTPDDSWGDEPIGAPMTEGSAEGIESADVK
jgi:hypothetical protein